MSDFFRTRTRMGQIFFDGTMPRIAKALERIADSMEREEAALGRLEKPAAARNVAELSPTSVEVRCPGCKMPHGNPETGAHLWPADLLVKHRGEKLTCPECGLAFYLPEIAS